MVKLQIVLKNHSFFQPLATFKKLIPILNFHLMKKNILLSMELVFGFCSGLFAQPGALDASFGIDGKVTTTGHFCFTQRRNERSVLILSV